jgi:hypothetical protein
MKRFAMIAAAGLVFIGGARSARATDQAETEAIYATWLLHFANHEPDQAIAMTSDDFIMVNNTTEMNRAAAQTFVEALAQFILSRQCTNQVIANQSLPLKSDLLLSRVDCQFQTVIGPLDAHFLETIVVDKKGVIVFDAFSDLANPSL